ncbi:MAG: peptidylprolyl isomerase [Anaerolineales bacterium]|nr:peptidylprolyl isomerase [Anaerolineales bacterium]MCX7756599.1 peptidylprolyl isomerase [Anaerolineales bacterium]MDW8277857.1 peptidylprolyl isomerase [Anaerolineales bacterium]
MEKPTVQDGQVVSLEYTLHVDGQLVDSSKGGAPLEFLQGAGNIIPGLEDELYGMEVGESKNVIVAAEDGYGELDPDAFVDVPRTQFPAEIPLQPGIELQVRDDAGRVLFARIDRVDDESVRLDFNHPLAGKELNFNVKVVGLRDATDEELEHGHVHGQGHAHH